MIENLFRPFRNEVVEFIEQDCGIPNVQAKIGSNILMHTFTGFFLKSIVRGEISNLYNLVHMKPEEHALDNISTLVIRCRNEFDRHLDIDSSECRFIALYLVNFAIGQIRVKYESSYEIRNQQTFRTYIMKAA